MRRLSYPRDRRRLHKEEGVNVQTVFVFKKTRGCFDVFQFRARSQILAQVLLHTVSFFVIRLD
jgi:hypothetical protein